MSLSIQSSQLMYSLMQYGAVIDEPILTAMDVHAPIMTSLHPSSLHFPVGCRLSYFINRVQYSYRSCRQPTVFPPFTVFSSPNSPRRLQSSLRSNRKLSSIPSTAAPLSHSKALPSPPCEPSSPTPPFLSPTMAYPPDYRPKHPPAPPAHLARPQPCSQPALAPARASAQL